VLNRCLADLGIDPEVYLSLAGNVLQSYPGTGQVDSTLTVNGPIRVGVDLGTAYTVMTVLDEKGTPLAGEYQYSQVVRDGLVVDYIGAVDLLRAMRERMEQRIGRKIDHAASAYPPGVPRAEVRATANVVEAAGMRCHQLTDEPSAANKILGLKDGVIVDVGGGTTGVAVLKNGRIVHTADEATGGTHFSLVIAGALDIPLEEAEELKKDAAQQARLFPLVRPVMEKVGSIVSRHVNGSKPDRIVLVGGTTLFPGMAEVIQEVTGINTVMPQQPMFVTPLGIAWQDTQELEE